MKLVDDWRAILLRAWSVRFAVMAAICGAAVPTLPALTDYLHPLFYAALMFVASVGSVVFPLLVVQARVTAQPKTLGGSDAGQ
ncbi:MAG TPA: hypothetical protein VNX29_02125 [Kaistia sp.]|nr:hypothetical protein [Kaistia sp.]